MKIIVDTSELFLCVYLTGVAGEGADAGLVAVVESLQFFFRHKVSSANLLEDLAREVNQMQLLRDLVTSGRMLLAAANSSRPEYERYISTVPQN